ncbi:hypothetical protein PanWU01x14_016140, partial [Parasponia andersonii]
PVGCECQPPETEISPIIQEVEPTPWSYSDGSTMRSSISIDPSHVPISGLSIEGLMVKLLYKSAEPEFG